MKPKITSTVIFILLLVLLSSCIGSIPITSRDATPATEAEGDVVPTDAETGPSSPDSIGTVSNMKTQVHAGARDDLKLIEGETPLGNDDFVSVTDGGKARLEFPGPISLLLFNQSEMDGIKLEYDQNSNPRIVNRLIRGGFSGYVAPGNQLTIDLAFGLKVNVLGTNFFIIYDEASDFIIIGKFDGTLSVSVPGENDVYLEDSELVDITSDGTIRHFSPISFTPSEFEKMTDTCNSPIQSVNILRRDNQLPLPGEATAEKDKELPCGSSLQSTPSPETPSGTSTSRPTLTSTVRPTFTFTPPPSGTCKDGYVYRLIIPSDTVCVSPASKAQADADNADAESRKILSVLLNNYGENACASGYVWRNAYDGDIVCVEPAVRDQVALDNAEASSRWIDGDYGPYTCISGYVWREAIQGDLVCVTPEMRDQTAIDNSQAESRFAINVYGENECISGYIWREAFQGDLVCVTPEVRQQVANDNSDAPNHTWP